MKKTSLSKAISIAVAGSIMSIGAISSASAETTAMYNKYTAPDGTLGLDGYVWGGPGQTSSGDPTNANPGWLGTAGGISPFGYIGSSHLNWAVDLQGANTAQEVSRQNAFDTYGVYADIDTARGAWIDAEGQGWKHHADAGLIQSDTTQKVHITLSAISNNEPLEQFGVTLFSGTDTNTGAYGHHGSWNNIQGFYSSDNPWGTTGLSYLDHDTSVDGENEFSFTAEAGEIYTLYLGGSGGANWGQGIDGYTLNISTSPVPVPAAAWLMGSGLIGLLSFGRRKKNNSI